MIPTVYIRDKDAMRMFAHSRATGLEVSGLGYVERTDDMTFNIYGTKCFKQQNTHVNTTIDPTAFAGEVMRDPVNASSLRLWWHSHSTFDVFWSAQDQAAIRNLGMFYDYLVSIVVNHAGASRIRIDDFKARVTYHEAKCVFTTTGASEENVKARARRNVKRLVRSVHNRRTY